MQKLNIIHIIDSLDIGGAEVLAVNSTRLLNKEKNIQAFLCATRKEGVLKKDIELNKYLFLNKKHVIDLKAIFKLKRFVNENKVSIIHAHSTSYFIAFFIKLIKPDLKIVWHDHYGNQENVKRKIQPLKFISRFFNFTIVVNENLLTWNKKNLNCKNLIRINNFSEFKSLNKLTQLKGEEGKRIIMLAALRPQKDHLNLLKSFLLIHNKHKDWTLHIIGDSENNEYKRQINNFIIENKLRSYVFLYGNVADIKNVLEQSTIGVLSSKSEGLPLTLIEYGMAKLPVVVTNVGDCSKIIDNGQSGFLVIPGEPKVLAKRIKSLIESEKLKKELGSRLYNYVIENYSKEKFINSIKNIYKQIN
jgi:glycosyltransferase involved in cell wall biosynthesis